MTSRIRTFNVSGSSRRPAYPGLSVINMAVFGCKVIYYLSMSEMKLLICFYLDFSPCCIWVSWILTADRVFSSSLLNSSKTTKAPTSHAPTRILPTATSLKFSSVLNTSTGLPNNIPRAFVDSVFPLPALP